jgi:hypothetical protein
VCDPYGLSAATEFFAVAAALFGMFPLMVLAADPALSFIFESLHDVRNALNGSFVRLRVVKLFGCRPLATVHVLW